MSGKAGYAVALHAEGYNCSQAVLGVFCDGYGLERAIAMRMAEPFGGGMRRGEVCGAVSGALLVLGLGHGTGEPESSERKAWNKKRTAAFMEEFRKRHGSYLCRDLLRESGKAICDQVIAGAVRLLEEFGCDTAVAS